MPGPNIVRPLVNLAQNPKVREAAVDIGTTAARQVATHVLARHDNGLPSARAPDGPPKGRAMAPRNGGLLSSMAQGKIDNAATQRPMPQAERPVRGRLEAMNPDDALPYLQPNGSWLATHPSLHPSSAPHASHSREPSGKDALTPGQAAVYAALWGGRPSVAPPVPPKIPLDSAPRQPMAPVPIPFAQPTLHAQRRESAPRGVRTDLSGKMPIKEPSSNPSTPVEAKAVVQRPSAAASPTATAWTTFKRSVRDYLSEAWEEGRSSGRQRGANEGYGNAGGGEERDNDGRWGRR